MLRFCSVFAAGCWYLAMLSFVIPSALFSTQSASADSRCQIIDSSRPSTLQSSSAETDPLAGNAAAQRVVTITKRWLAGSMSTPGMTAEVREISRGTVKGKLEVQYHIYVSGALKNQIYTLVDWPPNVPDPSPSIAGLSVLEDGEVVCAGRETDQCSNPDKPEKRDSPVKLVFYPLRGEIYRLALISQDQQAKMFFSVIPSPIRETQNGCSLEAVSLRLKNELVLIRGQGFEPYEEVTLESRSFEQTQTRADKVDGKGEYQLPMQPFVKGQGVGTMELKLAGAKCAPVLKFQWGN